MAELKETWLAIPDTSYFVSSFGQVKNTRGNLLKTILSTYGYFTVGLCHEGVRTKHMVGRLVLSAFVCPHDKSFRAHYIDWNRVNNRIDNLIWLPPKEIVGLVYIENKNPNRAEGNHCSKLSKKQVYDIRQLKGYGTAPAIAKIFNVSPTTIRSIWRQVTWESFTPLIDEPTKVISEIEESVLKFLENNNSEPFLRTPDILHKIGFANNKSNQMLVAKVLRTNGWERSLEIVRGGMTKTWKRNSVINL